MAVNDQPTTVSEQLPAGGNPSAPSSGTYGETAALDRLRQQLPGEGSASQASQVAPLPPMQGPPPLTPPSPGLPKAMFAPTSQPNVPASTPMTPMDEGQSAPTPSVISALEALANDTSRRYSKTSRRWASMVLEALKS